MHTLTQHQTQQTAGGTTMELTNEMPEFRPITLEKFYTIIIKSLCDIHVGQVDMTVL